MPAKLAITTVATSLGFLLVQLDVSIVNVALASIGTEIHTGVSGLQWVVDSYALTFAALLLSAGAVGDRIGARRVFIAGLLLFSAASLGCALAPNTAALIVARAVQGAGASALVPCSLALLNHACRDDAEARARAVSLWTAAGSIGLALGPVLGGALITAFGWRSIFLVNLPIGAAGVWLARRFVDEAATHAGGIDPAGQVLAILSLFCLTGAVIETGVLGWSSPFVWAGLALAALGFCTFIRVEFRGAQPMLPLTFFRNPTFAAATMAGFLLNLALYGAVFVLGLYFQQVDRWSPLRSGMALLPFAVAIFAANIASGRLAAIATPRVIVTGGLLVAALGIWSLRTIDPATSIRCDPARADPAAARHRPRGARHDVVIAGDRPAATRRRRLRRVERGAPGRRRDRRRAVRCADGPRRVRHRPRLRSGERHVEHGRHGRRRLHRDRPFGYALPARRRTVADT